MSADMSRDLNTEQKRIPQWARPLLLVLGLGLFVVGERLLGSHGARLYVTGLGALLLLGVLGRNLYGLAKASRGTSRETGPEEGAGVSTAWAWSALPVGLYTLAGVFYLAGLGLSETKAGLLDWAALMEGAWVLLVIFATMLLIFLEFALYSQPAVHAASASPSTPPSQSPAHPDHADIRRIRAAAGAGVRLALVLSLVATLNFTFNRLGWQWDLAYFKTTQVSEATLDVLTGLDEPVEVTLFFPRESAVGKLADDYFSALAEKSGGKLIFTRDDVDLSPEKAQKFGIRSNGMVAFRRGAIKNQLNLGETLDKARLPLAQLDQNVLTKLVVFSGAKRVVYYTVGHGERLEQRQGSIPPALSYKKFRQLAKDRNFQLKPLGYADGLATAVPKDAAMVLVADPRQPFYGAEADTLRAYLKQGGRMMALLEPRMNRAPSGGLPGQITLADLLKEYGMAYSPVMQANDRIFARNSYTKADHALLVTNRFGNHPASNTLRRNPAQNPVIFMGAGAFRGLTPPPGTKLMPVIQTMPGTWQDRNRNFTYDNGEPRSINSLVLAVSPNDEKNKRRPPGAPPKPKQPGDDKPAGPTILAFADADVVSDLLLQNLPNQTALEDALAWISGAEAPKGAPASEQDVRIRHIKADDWLWFYLPVVGVPLLLLGVGVWMRGRRGRKGGADV